MKNFFTFRQRPSESFTPTSRGFNGGRTGVERTVKGRSVVHRALCIVNLLIALSFGFSSQAWGDDGDFYNVYLAWTYNGTDMAQDLEKSGFVEQKLGELTSNFNITGAYLKCWDDWGPNYKSSGGQMIYKINNGDLQYWMGFSDHTAKSSNNYEYQKTGTLTIGDVEGASGKYTAEFWFQTWGWGDRYLNNGGGNYKFSYTILPPAVSGFASSVANSGGGSGTSSSPYIVFYNQDVNLTVSATASPDANSKLQFSFDDGANWIDADANNQATITLKRTQKTASNESQSVKYRYYNSSDALAGAEGSTTIYYRSAEYDLTLDHNDGSGNTTAAKVKYGADQLSSSITLPTRTGYKLDGFFKENSATTKVSTAAKTSKLQASVDGYTNSDSKWIKTTTPTTLYAGWTANIYKVTLNKGGSSSGAGSVDATYDAAMPSATEPSLTGYDFAGYYDGQNGTGTKYYDASMTSAHKWDKAENCTLYAYYTPKQYKITLEQTSATTSGTTEIMATYTQLLPAIANLPQRTGYTFGGYNTNTGLLLVNAQGEWQKNVEGFTDADGKWIKTTTATLSPIWNPITTIVTVNMNGGDNENQEMEETFDAEFDISSLDQSKFTRTGYDFKGLYTAQTGGSYLVNENWVKRSSSIVTGWLNGSAPAKWVNPNTTATIFAQWQAHTWTITLNDNEGTGGDGTKTATYGSSSNITKVTKPTRDNYSFAGYEDSEHVLVYNADGNLLANAGSYTDADRNWIYDNNVTLYAKWNSVGNYVVTLNNQSATTAGTTSVNVQINTTTGLTTNITCPEKTGYTFGGYFTQTGGSGTKLINADGSWVIPATDYINNEGKWQHNDNITLNAYWIANNYTVTLDNQNATTAGTESVQVTYNSTNNLTTAITVPEKTGYTFGGYFTDENGTGSQLINADGTWIKDVPNYTGTHSNNPTWMYANNCTLYAKWTFIDYTVNVEATTGGTIITPATSPITNAHYNVPFDIAAQTNPGYTFTNWTCSPENNIEFSETTAKLVIAGNASITANFTETMHTITIIGGTAASVQAGITTTGTATAAERTGYEFTNWTIPADNFTLVDCVVSAQTITFNATADGEVTANYIPSVYTNGVLSTADGTAGTYTATYDATSIVINTTPVHAGYQVEGYYQEEGLTNKIANADGSLVAVSAYVTDGKWNQTSAPALYTKWETATMTITLNVNVDTEVEVEGTDYTQGTASVAVHYLGNNFTSNPITKPTREGYTFNGYFTETEKGDKIIDAEGHFVTTDVTGWITSGNWQKNTESTIYAQWTDIPSTITFVNNGADITPGPSTLTAKYNSRSVWNADITIAKAGATFGGYYTDDNGTGVQLIGADGKWIANVTGYTGKYGQQNTPVWKHKGDVTLYAKWTTTGKVVYLKNTMNWPTAYVYFYTSHYNDGGNLGAGTHPSSPYVDGSMRQMTYNDKNGLFYVVVPSTDTYIYVGFTKDSQSGYDNFDQTEAIDCNGNFEYDKVVVVEREKNEQRNVYDDGKKYTKYYTSIEYQDLATAQGTGVFIPGTWSTPTAWETKNFEFAWDGTAKKCALALAEKTQYKFKIYTQGQYYGYNTEITESTAAGGVAFSTDDNNCKLTTKAAGNYVFEWKDGNKLRVTYPSSHEVTWGMGTVKGSSIDPTTTPVVKQPMGLVLEGTEVTFTAGAADPGYTWRGWYNADTYPGSETGKLSAGNNLSFTATINDTYWAYAIYTEETFNVTIASNDVNKGTVSPTAVTAGPAQQSDMITATPKAGYYFVNWTVPEGVTIAEGDANSPTIKLNATEAGKTLTANFAERWVLRGSRSDNSGDEGMPGFSTTDAVFSFAADATEGTKIVTLLPNREYKFLVYDKKHSEQRGYKNQNQKLEANTWTGTMNGTYHILMWSAGYGEYTFTVQEESTDAGTFPKVMITNPSSYQITMGTNTDHGEGGTLTATTTETIENVATEFDITTGQYVREGGSVVFTAAPKTGYTFQGFYSDAECQISLREASVGLTYTINDVTAEQSVYAKFTENLTPVTLRINGDGKVKVGDVEQTEGAIYRVGVCTTVTFTTEPGSNVQFKGWTKSSGADFTMEGNTLKGNGAGLTDGQILTANFGELDKIYFLNHNFGGQYQWTDVHVYFDAYWDNTDAKKGAGANGKSHVHMTQIEGTNIWWAYVPSNFTGTNVAFSQEDMNNYENFSKVNDNDSHGVYRNDFKKAHNMYVPVSSTAFNNCYYFSDGYWMKYDPEASEGVGYYLKRKTDGYQYGEFQASEFDAQNGTLTSTITISVDANTNLSLYVVSAGAENYADGTTFTKDDKGHELSKYKDNPNFTFTPNGTGDYTFKLTQGTGLKMRLDIDYPNNDNDYRVIYNNGTKDHPSHAIQPNDKVSFFVNKTNGKFRIQQLTSGAWTDVTGATNLDIPGTITNDSVYVFQLANDGKSLTNEGAYTGDYYIRTDRAGGGWHNYKGNENNLMVKGSIYGYNDTYDYAYTQWCPANTNVKYTIANDYSLCISDSLAGDDVIGDVQALGLEGANIRFMWDSKTNQLKRDYIGGSNKEQFLYIHGGNAETGSTASKLYLTKEATSPVDGASFHDDGNWVYSKEFYVEPGAYIALTAKFNNKYQFFYGEGEGEGDATECTISKYASFVGGESGGKLRMKVIYNFKTNELIAGYIPDGGTISNTIDLSSDLLWVRGMQNAASAINFAQNDLQIKNIKKVYGVLELNKQTMTNLYEGDVFKPLNGNSYDRCLYWISFPFKVNISDIFGIDGYGTKWILQRYRGDLRAKNGWFAETTTFWEYMGENEYLEPYVGYVLCLDPTYFDETSDEVWQNVETKIAFYFPSANPEDVDSIQRASQTVTVPEHECKIERTFTVGDNELSHKETDSNWNVIGIPAFEDLQEDIGEGKYIGLKALYQWNPATNGYTVQAVSGTQSYTFQAMKAYMVQFAGVITWSNASVVQKSVSPSVAPRRLEETAHYMAEIEFHQGDKANDHTYINLADNATTDFLLNEDMMKIDNAGCPNIYSFAGNYNVAYNETSKASQTIDLGVSAPAAGNYKFHMPSDFTGTVTLIDNVEQTRTNLQVQDYELYLDKGTYNDRFQLEINLQSVVTNLDNVFGGQLNSDHAVKFIRDDKMFILRSGSIFDATGKKVK